MTLRPNFNVCLSDDLKSFKFYDFTKAYSATTNPTGYGTVNPATTDVTNAYIEVTLPGTNVVVSIQIKGGTIVSDLPTTDTTKYFTVTNVLLGLTSSDKLPDGVYTIGYRLTGTYNGDAFEESNSCKRFFTGQVELCLDKKLVALEAPDSDCGCSDPDSEINKVNKLLVLLTSAIYAASVYKINKATKILEYVTDICNNEPCEDC